MNYLKGTASGPLSAEASCLQPGLATFSRQFGPSPVETEPPQQPARQNHGPIGLRNDLRSCAATRGG